MTDFKLSAGDASAKIVALARFAVLGTLALSAMLFLADVGRPPIHPRFLSETVIRTVVIGIAVEAMAAMAALLVLSFRRSD